MALRHLPPGEGTQARSKQNEGTVALHLPLLILPGLLLYKGQV